MAANEWFCVDGRHELYGQSAVYTQSVEEAALIYDEWVLSECHRDVRIRQISFEQCQAEMHALYLKEGL